jgi:large subunit ribosomal protein L2
MGKRIISRARGHGGPRYRSPGHRFVSTVRYDFDKAEIVDIVHDPARDAPLARLKTNNQEKYIIAAEGIRVGDFIDKQGEAKIGNVLPLNKIPKGLTIFAIENYPGSGPKLCCTAGTRAIVISHDLGKVIAQMPSKEFKVFNPNCLATIGIPAGGGRGDKPFVKAGQLFYLKHARNKLWPRSSAVKMNPVDHPFGGHTKPGTPKTISRLMSPGAKVGSISARRSGKKKK